MGYSSNESMVRVDFFKESGKWYTTEAVNFDVVYLVEKEDFKTIHPVDALKLALEAHLKGRLNGMWAVCLKPYCALDFPAMIKVE